MVLRTSINIAPNTLQDLTIDNLDKEGTPFENYYPKVFSRADLESMIFDDIIETDVVAASGDERFTFSSTGFNTIQKTFNELLDLAMADTPLIMTPSLDVSVLSDGTNSYAIKDAQARSDIASLQTSKVPNTRTVNGKALSSDITLTASDVGALSSISSSDVTTALGYTPLQSSDISNMVTTDTTQNITAKKVLGGSNLTMLSQPGITKGTNPATTQYINFGLMGSDTSAYTDRLGCLETSLDSSGNVTTFLRAYKNEASSSTVGSITVNYPSSGSPYAEAPTPTEDTNNSVQIDTVGARNTKLADYALDSNVVKTSGNQNVGGAKTFTDNITVSMNVPTILLKDTNYSKGTAPSGNNDIAIKNQDSSGNDVASFLSRTDTSGNQFSRMISYKQTTGTSAYCVLQTIYRANGEHLVGFFSGSQDSGDKNLSETTVTSATSNSTIPTMGWVNNPATSTNVVHRSDSETITGTKTFTNSPIFNMQCYTANNGSSNTNQYKKIATGIKTGTNSSFIIPFMFCASNTQITSGTYNGKIACRTSSTAGSANVSSSGIVLNGNPDFISNGNIVFYLMYKNNYPESDQVTFEVWVYVKNTYQGVNVMPLRIGTGATGQDINAMTWGDNMTSTNALPDGFTAINQIIL